MLMVDSECGIGCFDCVFEMGCVVDCFVFEILVCVVFVIVMFGV